MEVNLKLLFFFHFQKIINNELQVLQADCSES